MRKLKRNRINFIGRIPKIKKSSEDSNESSEFLSRLARAVSNIPKFGLDNTFMMCDFNVFLYNFL